MSLRKAIDAKCRECIYDPVAGSGNWRQQVSACTADGRNGGACPLFDVRPMSKPTKPRSPLTGREFGRKRASADAA